MIVSGGCCKSEHSGSDDRLSLACSLDKMWLVTMSMHISLPEVHLMACCLTEKMFSGVLLAHHSGVVHQIRAFASFNALALC